MQGDYRQSRLKSISGAVLFTADSLLVCLSSARFAGFGHEGPSGVVRADGRVDIEPERQFDEALHVLVMVCTYGELPFNLGAELKEALQTGL